MTCKHCDLECHHCSAVGVVWIELRLLCGSCYLAYAKTLTPKKREDSALDCAQKIRREEKRRKVA